MPWDMILSMPIQERRYFIQRHNEEQAQESKRNSNAQEGVTKVEGSAINSYAEAEQKKRMKRG